MDQAGYDAAFAGMVEAARTGNYPPPPPPAPTGEQWEQCPDCKGDWRVVGHTDCYDD